MWRLKKIANNLTRCLQLSARNWCNCFCLLPSTLWNITLEHLVTTRTCDFNVWWSICCVQRVYLWGGVGTGETRRRETALYTRWMFFGFHFHRFPILLSIVIVIHTHTHIELTKPSWVLLRKSNCIWIANECECLPFCLMFDVQYIRVDARNVCLMSASFFSIFFVFMRLFISYKTHCTNQGYHYYD